MESPPPHSRRPPPPLGGGGGGGGGSMFEAQGAPLASDRTTPLPNPPPQGGREHTEPAARSCPPSPQFQGRKARERQHDRDDPEPDHDLRLGPALLLEVMM